MPTRWFMAGRRWLSMGFLLMRADGPAARVGFLGAVISEHDTRARIHTCITEQAPRPVQKRTDEIPRPAYDVIQPASRPTFLSCPSNPWSWTVDIESESSTVSPSPLVHTRIEPAARVTESDTQRSPKMKRLLILTLGTALIASACGT